MSTDVILFSLVFLMSFLTVYALTPFIIKLAYRTNFVDKPEARKLHLKVTPLLGGLGVFIGFIAFSTLGIHLSADLRFSTAVTGYLLGAVVILITGIIDDRIGLNPGKKMIGQVLASAIFLYSQRVYSIDFLHMLGPVWITVPVMLLWMIGLINALNFLDNMDGIISGMSAIIALGFYGFAVLGKTPVLAAQCTFIAIFSLAFAGALFGFLPHNFKPASIFLGDTGSMFIGYFLSTMGILVGRVGVLRQQSMIYYLIPVLLLSYAIFDISLVSWVRRREGRKITQGGKDHSTHRIGNATGSQAITALIVYLINLILVLITLLIFKMQSPVLLVSATACFIGIFLLFGRTLYRVPTVPSTPPPLPTAGTEIHP